MKRGRPKKEDSEKRKMISLRLHPVAKKQLGELCKRENLSQSKVIEQALDCYYKNTKS